MRVLLISANTETFNMPTLPMGLGCVAAALKKKGTNLYLTIEQNTRQTF